MATTVNEKELEPRVHRLLERLSEELGFRYRIRSSLGQRAPRPDLIVDLSGPGKEHHVLAIELRASEHSAGIAQAAQRAREAGAALNAVPIVAVPRLGSRMARWLREQGIGYIDLQGKAFIRAPGMLVDRSVREADVLDRSLLSFSSVGSPFADRSSLVLRHLLANAPVYPGVRELASELRVSPGLVSRVLRRLRDEGYVKQDASGRGRLVSVELLLQDWAEFYARRAGRQRDRRLYIHARDAQAIMSRLAESQAPMNLPKWALSFQAGASLVAPFAIFSEVHVLLGGPVWEESAEIFCQRFELVPAGEEANVILVEPHYRDSWSYGIREIRGLPVVSDIQLYLDLLLYPMRGREQASRVLERIVGKPVEAVGE